MPKTTNLNLNLTTDTTTTLVSDWQISLDGEGDGTTVDFSNMQLIDAWAGSINSQLDGLLALLESI